MANIYVASSWRNPRQPDIVKLLRSLGHDVYDFREGDAFGWHEIDPDWKTWSPEKYRENLDHPLAKKGFARDMGALRECDVCVLVMPCGRSAHLEAGWAAGAGKKVVALLSDGEPELMLAMVDVICTGLDELVEILERTEDDDEDRLLREALQTATTTPEELERAMAEAAETARLARNRQ